MKLTTICDVSHVISYTRPSSPLFFSGGIERKAWDRGYSCGVWVTVSRPPPVVCGGYSEQTPSCGVCELQ